MGFSLLPCQPSTVYDKVRAKGGTRNNAPVEAKICRIEGCTQELSKGNKKGICQLCGTKIAAKKKLRKKFPDGGSYSAWDGAWLV